MSEAPLFGAVLMNVPIVNLRQEFRYWLSLFENEQFREHVRSTRDAIYTDYAAYPTREALFTHVAQRVVMGIESYLPWAVLHEGTLRKVLTAQMFTKTRNPFSLGGRSTVANYYDRLPSLLDPTHSLRAVDPELYDLTIRFYREVRNPLFHGHELHNDDGGQAVLEILRFIGRLYAWIDSWCPLEDLWKKSRDTPEPTPLQNEQGKPERVRLNIRIPTLRRP